MGSSETDIVLGIDFGTSSCRVTASAGGMHREVVVPSVVSTGPQGGLVAGDEAVRLTGAEPELAVEGIKRLIGRSVGTPEVEWLAAGTPQLLVQGHNRIGVQLAGTMFSAQALAHALMRQVVVEAERAVGSSPHKRRIPTVIAIPAMFDMPQRQALVNLAFHAGLDVQRLVEAPAATLLALDPPADVRRAVVVDVGAGYFDICIIERHGAAWSVMGSDGDTLLGTEDLDQRVMHHLIEAFHRQHGYDLSTIPNCIARIKRLARQIRLDAFERQPTSSVLPDMIRARGRSLPLVSPPLGVRDLEALWAGELDGLIPPVFRLFEELGLGSDDVDALYLSGGGGHVPMVQWRFEEVLQREATIVEGSAMFAARGAAKLARQPDALRSVLPHAVSLIAADREPVLVTARNQPLPLSSSHIYVPEASRDTAADLWLCQGVADHPAFRFGHVHLDSLDAKSYVIELSLGIDGHVGFDVRASAMLDLESESEKEPEATEDPDEGGTEIPPMSAESPEIDVAVEALEDVDWELYGEALDFDDELDGGPPTVQAHRVADAAAATQAPTTPEVEKVMRRSLFGSVPDELKQLRSTSLPKSSPRSDPAPASSRSAKDPLVGAELGGRYAILKILGEGSMARVYAARHAILDTMYAIKVMHPPIAAEPTLRERFLNEARGAARIDSDHVVRILDFGQVDDGRDYFVMEYLEGSSLEDEIDKRLLPLDLVITSGIHIAMGLEAAHAHDIVHRDLKPENVWLTTVGNTPRIKILDFGVAKIPTGTAGLTMGNSIVGTPYYMAPEQVSGEVDARTDIYATGIMLFELVTGRLPFYHESLAFVLAMQCERDLPSPRELAGPLRCSPALERIIRKCTHKKKEMRYQSASKLRAALESLAQTDG